MRCIITLLCALLIQSLCFSATLYVDDDFDSATPGWGVDHFAFIQEAIGAAAAGDEIIVSPGTYYENIDFFGKAITLRSDLDGDPLTYDVAPNLAIIDGSQAGSVVSIASAEQNTTVLDGFTITNGSGTPNGPDMNGGGVYIHKSSPTIKNNIIVNNTVVASNYALGGGVYCYNYNYYYKPIITNNLIAENSAGQGGGVYCFQGGITMTNNTITNNNAPIGGGFRMRQLSALVTNTIIWGNTSFDLSLDGVKAAITFNHCCLGLGWGGPGVNNITADPQFVDPMGDYHLSDTSPCIDTGDNAAPELSAVDFDGEDRIIDGDAVPGAVVDMGVDEVFGNEPPTADLVCEQLTNIGSSALMRLDGSGSTDPEDDLADLRFEWTIDGIPSTETDPVIEIYLPYGPHNISLKVIDTSDAFDVIAKDLQIDPAALSVFDPLWVKVNWHTKCSYVDVKGEIGLPSGMNYSELDPMVENKLDMAGLPALPLNTVLFNVYGHHNQRWRYCDKHAVTGITHFRIDWRGARYYFRERCFPVKLRSQIISSEETVLTIYLRNKKIKTPFTIDFDSQNSIEFDENGQVLQADMDYEVDREGRQISVTLPFPIVAQTLITMTGGVEKQLVVGDRLKESVGRFFMRMKFDSNLYLQGVNTQPRTMDFEIYVGMPGYPGEFHLGPDRFKAFWNRWFHFKYF